MEQIILSFFPAVNQPILKRNGIGYKSGIPSFVNKSPNKWDAKPEIIPIVIPVNIVLFTPIYL
jgi:hypothetical protein